jgi:flavin reductase (DIM6/NTAB) family NADH-FMN oxidoreductase RutF
MHYAARNQMAENDPMHFDLGKMPAQDGYKLMISTVVPRPIALATTVDAQGRVNAAPFSFFNAVSSNPPVVVLGINGEGADGGYKDTEDNIRETGEFVVNLVDEALAERMNICAVDFPTEIGELEVAKLTPLPSIGVKPPRIAESPVSFECKRIAGLSLGGNSTMEVGRVIHIHIRDDLMDMEKLYVKTDKIGLIGRMHGRGWYARTSDLFLMDRMSLADWQARRK